MRKLSGNGEGKRGSWISERFISRSVPTIDTGSSDIRYADDRIGYDSIKYVLSSGHVGYWSGYVRRVGPVDTLTSGDDGIRCARFRHQDGESMLQGMCVCRKDEEGGSHTAGSNRFPEVC